jgi:glutaredoxin 3
VVLAGTRHALSRLVPVIVMYMTPYCPYCRLARDLLRSKGVHFTEIDVSRDPELRRKMTARANGRRTVPQIFIGDHHVGGCDDLHKLDRRGGLEPMLGMRAQARA